MITTQTLGASYHVPRRRRPAMGHRGLHGNFAPGTLAGVEDMSPADLESCWPNCGTSLTSYGAGAPPSGSGGSSGLTDALKSIGAGVGSLLSNTKTQPTPTMPGYYPAYAGYGVPSTSVAPAVSTANLGAYVPYLLGAAAIGIVALVVLKL